MENIEITSASLTDIGKRSENEDRCLIVPETEIGSKCSGVYIIADGMGGRSSGSVASKTAVDTAKDVILKDISQHADVSAILSRALRTANMAVYNKAKTDPALNKMGTTCVASVICHKKLYYAHLGDSRAYILQDGQLKQLTEDHSYVAEKLKTGEISDEDARKSKFRNIITKAVGIEPNVEPDVGSIDLHEGDIILLCTDGLTVPLSNSFIENTLLTATPSNIKSTCVNLIDAALNGGGKDNITVILIMYGTPNHKRKPITEKLKKETSKKKSPWAIPFVIGILAGILLGMLIGSYFIKLPEKNVKDKAGSPVAIEKLNYSIPVPMLSTKINGGILSINKQGIITIVDEIGQMIKIDKNSGEIYTSPAKMELIPEDKDDLTTLSAVDKDGNIYITDSEKKTIFKYYNNSAQKDIIAAGKLEKPQAVSVDDDGNIYVIDSNTLKVIKPVTASKPAANTAEKK